MTGWQTISSKVAYENPFMRDVSDGITACKRVSFAELDDMILSGKMQCTGSITAYYMCKTYLEKEL